MLSLGCLLFITGCDQSNLPDTKPVQEADIKRLTGHWYVRTSLPNYFIRLNPIMEAELEVISGEKLSLTAYSKGILHKCKIRYFKHIVSLGSVQNKSGLRQQELCPSCAGRRIIGLDPLCSWQVITSLSGKKLWILTRDPNPEMETGKRILSMLTEKGFRTIKLNLMPVADF
ncbi:MAG: hypothetical protein CVU06_14050 [Bacteroidetes bacterium HGW-Bacteroidetes-22]|nr:MAG: hypothetical protein CVU06_14050 [Bacteroidetes bacterium HGW-Bacteroidetes-22]